MNNEKLNEIAELADSQPDPKVVKAVRDALEEARSILHYGGGKPCTAISASNVEDFHNTLCGVIVDLTNEVERTSNRRLASVLAEINAITDTTGKLRNKEGRFTKDFDSAVIRHWFDALKSAQQMLPNASRQAMHRVTRPAGI
jgi:hypothetical protein